MSLITISSNFGCNIHDISKKISNELKLDLYDEKRIHQEAMKLNVEKEDVNLLQEKAPSFMKRVLLINPEFYYYFTESIIYEIAQKGSGIILGYAGQILFKNFDCALKVRVYAPFQTRVKNVIKEYKVNENEAKKMIKHHDNNQRNFFKYIFNTDYESSELYDLVINTDKIDANLATELIIDALKSNKIKECSPLAISDMKKLSLEKRISFELDKNSINISNLNIKVHKNGVAEFNGFLLDLSNVSKLEKIVKEIDGISDVKTDIKVFTQYYSI
jgi:cytidylate kinase